MTRDQNTAPAFPAVSLPVDLLESNWRVVRRDSEGNADDTLYSFPEKKSQPEVREWAERKFADCEICSVFPKDYESREWVVLHSYRQGLPMQVDRLSLAQAVSSDAARQAAQKEFTSDFNFTVYPTSP